MSRLPLEGIRVLEVGQAVAGPTAGLVLADLGAEVIKVEPPVIRDEYRLTASVNGQFYFVNRNKRSAVLDLKDPRGKEAFIKLARTTDVVVENMAPKTMERMGIGYEELAQVNPRIIYCSVKGFLSGPYQDRLALDELAQMEGGLAYMTGPLGQPLRAGTSVVDMGAGTYGVVGVMGALLERERTGRGQKITVGLLETTLFWMGLHLARAQTTGECPLPMPSGERMWAVYDLFRCLDSKQVFVAVINDAQWERFCRRLGLAELLDDPRLTTNGMRRQERDWLMPRLQDALGQFDSGALVEAMVEAGVPVAPVNTPQDLLADPHVNAGNRMLPIRMGHGEGKLPALPIESSSYTFSARLDPPLEPGIHTREVLAEAGYSPAQIEDLLEKGIAK